MKELKTTLKYTRKVLFEKFNIKHEMREFLLSQIDGCEIKLLERYPDSIFFVKNDELMFEQDFKNGRLFTRYNWVWSVFESKYQLSREQTQVFITDTLEGQLKMDGFTTAVNAFVASSMLEGQLKIDGLTPNIYQLFQNILREPAKNGKNGGIAFNGNEKKQSTCIWSWNGWKCHCC